MGIHKLNSKKAYTCCIGGSICFYSCYEACHTIPAILSKKVVVNHKNCKDNIAVSMTIFVNYSHTPKREDQTYQNRFQG